MIDKHCCKTINKKIFHWIFVVIFIKRKSLNQNKTPDPDGYPIIISDTCGTPSA